MDPLICSRRLKGTYQTRTSIERNIAEAKALFTLATLTHQVFCAVQELRKLKRFSLGGWARFGRLIGRARLSVAESKPLRDNPTLWSTSVGSSLDGRISSEDANTKSLARIKADHRFAIRVVASAGARWPVAHPVRFSLNRHLESLSRGTITCPFFPAATCERPGSLDRHAQ